jgi:hypothetical protein
MPKDYSDYSLEELQDIQEQQQKKSEKIFYIFVLVGGTVGLLYNRHLVRTWGLYDELAAISSPAIIIFGIYSLLFPDDFSRYAGIKKPPRVWIAFILAIFSGIVNLLASKYQ